MASRFYLTIPDTQKLDGVGPFGFRMRSAEGIAEDLQAALQGDGLFQRRVATQEEPDETTPRLGATDPSATVSGSSMICMWTCKQRRASAVMC